MLDRGLPVCIMIAIMAKAELTTNDFFFAHIGSGKPFPGARAVVKHECATCVFHPTALTEGGDENKWT